RWLACRCSLEQLERRSLLSTGISMFSDTKIEGTSSASFPVFLYGEDNADEIRVDYRTADGTATSGSDYTASSGTLVFPPHAEANGIWNYINVPIRDDAMYENRETFIVQLSNPKNAAIDPLLLSSPAQGSIVDNDPMPTLAISDVALYEGNNGAIIFNFAV